MSALDEFLLPGFLDRLYAFVYREFAIDGKSASAKRARPGKQFICRARFRKAV